MTNSILGFNQEAVIKYGLNGNDLIFLNWVKGFASSIKIKRWADPKTKETYFWIKYSKVLSDLPFMFKNIFSLRKTISKLSSTIRGERPLLIKLIRSQKGTETYFAFDPKVRSEMEDAPMTENLFGEPIQEKQKAIKDKDYQKIPANETAVKIYSQLKKIEHNGKSVFINHTMPADSRHYNSTFGIFQERLFALYEGHFLKDYSLDMTDWFQEKYRYYLRKEDIISLLRSCKGNWEQIKKVLLAAGETYAKWFAADSEQQNKNKLPRSINDWLYSIHNKSSMFYVCLLEPPTSQREAQAEKVFNAIPECYRIIFNFDFIKEWDGFTYWNKIRGVIKWYENNASDLIREDSNCIYWLGGSGSFFSDYINWILNLTNWKPFLNNFGVGNKTWDLYIAHKRKEHNIEIEIPRSNA